MDKINLLLDGVTDLSCIYVVTNNITKDQYVGKAKSIRRRWYQHNNGSRSGNKYLYRAIRKYGISNFTMSVVDTEYSNEKEVYWIDKLKPKYNLTRGGDGGWINDQTGKTWKVKDKSKIIAANRIKAQKRIGVPHKKVASGNNYQCNYIIHTPWGKFESWKDACDSAKKLRDGGNKLTISDRHTLRLYCLQDIILNESGRRTPKEWRGKSTHSLGFKFEEKAVMNEIR